jgi:hypothetical protein
VQDGNTVGLTTTVTSNVGISVTYTDIYVSNTDQPCNAQVSIGYKYPLLNVSAPNGRVEGVCIFSGAKALQESGNQSGTCDPYNPASWSSSCTMAPVCANPIINIRQTGTNSSGYPTYTGDAQCNGPNGLFVCNTNYSCGTSSTCSVDPCYNPITNIQSCGTDSNGNTVYCGVQTCDGNDGSYICNTNYACGTDPTCGNSSIGNQSCTCSPIGSPGALALAASQYCASGQKSTAAKPCISQAGSNGAQGLSSAYGNAIETDMDTLSGGYNESVLDDLIAQLEGLYNETNGCTNNN